MDQHRQCTNLVFSATIFLTLKMDTQKEIAKALLRINAVGFSIANPIVFTSGIKAPVYVDNRKFPFWPEQWHLVIEGFQKTIEEQQIPFDVIAGIETAGIPHSSAFAYKLHTPSVFVRKKAKEHGTKGKIEGGNVVGKRVLLIEDLVTTGGSSLAGVQALREAGAIVTDCLVIVTYGFGESQKAFEEAQVNLHALTSFVAILQEAEKLAKITPKERETIQTWLQNPYEGGSGA